jgi:hypothetical protein
MWTIVVNRKLSSVRVYGTFGTAAEAYSIAHRLVKRSWVDTLEVMECNPIRVEDGQRSETAFTS